MWLRSNAGRSAGGPAFEVLPIQLINPLECSAWDSWLVAQSDAEFFHTSAWARVLHETYGHRPVYFCQASESKPDALLPLMEVASAFTGRRGVSLPFTDFCPPLRTSGQGMQLLYQAALDYGRSRGWRSMEGRSHGDCWPGAAPSLKFFSHVIDLRLGAETLFKRFDGAMRQGIRKAEKAKLQVEFDTSRSSVQEYYKLHCITRRKHGLPPQPKRFFDNIGQYALRQKQGVVALLRRDKKAIAGMVILHHGKRAIYKFGASDPDFQQLRPNNLLMWESIKRLAGEGFESLHLGRTSLNHEGLRRFKLAFGAREDSIEYQKYDFARGRFVADADRVEGWFNPVFRAMPAPLLRLAGEVLYPHLS